LGAYLPGCFQAVQMGHSEIHKDDLRPIRFGQLDRLPPIGRDACFMTLRAQNSR
jgi:hypothetical protein